MDGGNSELSDVVIESIGADETVEPEVVAVPHGEIEEKIVSEQPSMLSVEDLLCHMGKFIMAGIFVKR